MTQNEIEKLVWKLTSAFDEVNVLYIKKIAEQVKKIGELNPTSVHRIAVMAEMTEDIAEINRLLADTVNTTVAGIHDLYTEALNSMYYDPRFERALQEAPLPEASKRKLEYLAQMIARQTSGSMMNLSNATALTQGYQSVIDRAILTVTSGIGDYKTAMRDSIRSLGSGGMQVQYASGYHRRLDSAVRQNILDGTRQIAQQGSMMMGEMLDYDAYEISAHARSAPDHEPVQGRVFLIEEFSKLQNDMDCIDINGKTYEGFPRSIGEWNCMHIVMSFSTKYSKPRYTEEQLQKFAEDNAKGCMIDGRHYTLYEASQLMRKIEVQIRSQKDTAVAARIVDDEVLQRECQLKIDALSNRYTKIADASGIKPRRDRMQVQGFKRYNVASKDSENKIGKQLSQSYRPVERGDHADFSYNATTPISAQRIITYKEGVYVAENASVKPKALHQIVRNTEEAMSTYGIPLDRKPTIVIAKAEDILSFGKYDAINNTVYYAHDIADRSAMKDAGGLGSTEYHEMWHLKQAENYRNKGNEITSDNYGEYIKKACKIAMLHLEHEGVTEYNVGDISDYAKKNWLIGRYDEVEAEYVSKVRKAVER